MPSMLQRASAPFSAAGRECLLEARDVRHQFGRGVHTRQVLRGVSIGLRGGELALLMGPSGSGKTTLLSILGCMLKPSAGSVHVNGEATSLLSPGRLSDLRRRQIGFIFQSFNLLPTLTAEENVRIALDIRGETGGAAVMAALKTLQSVGLLGKAQSYPAKLSGGERQRLAVARAIVARPAVILADEPTASLDTASGMAVMALLKRLALEPGRAVLAVTHDPRTVPFADRILLIEDGSIVQERLKPEGVITLNDLSLAREQPQPVRIAPCAVPEPCSAAIPARERHFAAIKAVLARHNPDCQSPITVADILKARLAQRRRDGAHSYVSAREDILSIAADWDNPEDSLAAQSDACLESLAELLKE